MWGYGYRLLVALVVPDVVEHPCGNEQGRSAHAAAQDDLLLQVKIEFSNLFLTTGTSHPRYATSETYGGGDVLGRWSGNDRLATALHGATDSGDQEAGSAVLEHFHNLLWKIRWRKSML